MSKHSRRPTPPVLPRKPLRVRINNRLAVFDDASPETLAVLVKYFQFRRPNYEFTNAYRFGDWDGYVSLLKRNTVGTGLFLAKREELNKRFRIQVTDQREFLRFKNTKDLSLRSYQHQALRAMKNASNTGGLILSATGTGKTRLAGAYFRDLIGTGVFVVNELGLLRQARKELAGVIGEPVGMIGQGVFDPRRITVSTIQTMDKRKEDRGFCKWLLNLDAMLVDEFHLMLNKRIRDMVRLVVPYVVFGFTATLQLQRPDIWIPSVEIAGSPIFEYPIEQGVKQGYLSEGRIYIVEFNDPLRGIGPSYVNKNGKRIEAGSPAAEYRYHVSLNKARNDLIEGLARAALEKGRKIFVLVEHLSHLRALDKRLRDVKHYSVCGAVKAEDRIRVLREMDQENLRLILATNVFAKGVDVPSLDCIIDATGVPNPNNVIQRYGRGTRRAEGKKGLLFFDIADRNSPFEDASKARQVALRQTGSPIFEIVGYKDFD